MLPNSIEYFAFLAIAVICYYVLPHRCRNVFLLVVSYLFYFCFDWHFGGLLLFQTLICYGLAWWIGGLDKDNYRQWLVVLACVLSFSSLAFFKYYNFCNDSLRSLFTSLGLPYLIPHLNILLPVGISFYTFQSLSYVIDVYRRKCSVETSFVKVALFVGFFPQLAAGPIGRVPELLPQFSQKKMLSSTQFESAVNQVLWGLFKKVVIADRLAYYVNAVYGNLTYASGPSLALAAVFFSIQIYCDFSGYSDIAIGSARLFGIELRKNFDFPYFATTINDFWKKWHISLTSWFRDYLYIPLGGNRCSHIRWMSNVLLVFIVSGLWHGANWSFMVWGSLHGVLQLLEIAIRGRKAKDYGSWAAKLCGCLFTFLLVTIAWIFFRMPNVNQAWRVLIGIASWKGRLALGVSQVTFLLNILLVILFVICEFIYYRKEKLLIKETLPLPGRVLKYALLLAAVSLFGVSSDTFIYLQF